MPRVSIIIRAKDKADSIEVVLRMIYAQTFKDFEVIIVDSGSTDSTLERARKFPVRILEIPSEQFTYGYALNVGCAQAQGAWLVALSAHCIPKSSCWLENLTLPISDPKVAGVTSDGIHGYLRWDLEAFLVNPHIGLSNANSAYRADLWKEKPFNENMLGTEDKEWQYYFLKQGYCVINVSGAEVFRVDQMDLKHRYRKAYWESHGYTQFLPDAILFEMMVGFIKRFLSKPSRWELWRFMGSCRGLLNGRRDLKKRNNVPHVQFSFPPTNKRASTTSPN
ncbi:MAG: glycosyltransferase family 2 protein [Nitrospinae bacterium]|nr:glycosyltransferase family 2 protein [Nitrospinota bacterium]